MQTKNKAPKNGTIRRRVRATQVFQNLGKIQQGIVSTGQNIKAIHSSLKVVKQNGIKHWESVSQNSQNNAEIIRELYANELEVKF
ncbi:MAG: hypothetical protein H7Y10_12135 [Flavobacterium sp.]|nr:hypothetical protein [Flavobacterium sp.]